MTPRRRRGRPRGENRISYAEAAAILGVTETTVARWVADGYLVSFVTGGGYHKLYRDEVLRLAEDRKRNQ